MSLRVEAYAAGPLDTNAYLVADAETGAAILVDAPPGVTETLLEAVRAGGYRVTRIVITHAHWDHVVDAAALRAASGLPLAAHPLAKERLAHPSGSSVFDLPFDIPPVAPDEWLEEGDTIPLGGRTLAVLHLPGHDPAHIALYDADAKVLIGGDVFFPGGHGTTEIPLADQAAMDRSIARLAALPPDVTVYPGHGLPTTIGAETAWTEPIRQRVETAGS
jgi:glyoxylase-like metal-dependent hydrolase (beta-lactamase superfamily II)